MKRKIKRTVAGQQAKKIALARSANRIAIDALQCSNYITDNKGKRATKNLVAVIRAIERLIQQLKAY